MKIKVKIVILLSFIALCTISCDKDPSFLEDYFNLSDGDVAETFLSSNNGDDKKIDVKGSLMNGDMKHPNIVAWLSGKTLYVRFNETIENCMILLSTSSQSDGRVVFSKRVAKLYPTIVRIYMGDKPSGEYRLYITDGIHEAEGLVPYIKIDKKEK